MIFLRNLLFKLLFYGGSVPIVLTTPFSALLGWRAMVAHTHFWTRWHGWTTRNILGIDQRIEGARFGDMTSGGAPVLYAAKHQSMYETLELGRMLHTPAIVMKQELTDIPVWGWAARRYGVIVVDREASAGALRRMLKEARAALADQRSILIFPEGTRVAPGEQPELARRVCGAVSNAKDPGCAGGDRQRARMAEAWAENPRHRYFPLWRPDPARFAARGSGAACACRDQRAGRARRLIVRAAEIRRGVVLPLFDDAAPHRARLR